MKRSMAWLALFVCFVQYGQDSRSSSEIVGQISVTEQLYVLCSKSENAYYFKYTDAGCPQRTPRTFLTMTENDEFEKLYHAMMQGNPKVPCRASKVGMAVDDIWLEFSKRENEVNVRFLQNISSPHTSYSAWLTKSEVNILFGKG